ncbi:hypothetical protein ACFL2Q_11660, partial [Thermodesulfobacteriota bacterium]
MNRFYLYGLHNVLGKISLLLILFLGIVVIPCPGHCETYGLKDAGGNFVPKVAVTMGDREILIKKVNPEEGFKSIALRLNKAKRKLFWNVGHLKIQWIDSRGRPGKQMLFAGPHFNQDTRVFKDTMTKSIGLKVIDKSNQNLFAEKDLADLFTISVNGRRCISSDSFYEKEKTVKMGEGKDVSIKVDKKTVVFSEDNVRKGEMINVENRSRYDKTIGIKLPVEGLFFRQVVRKLDQTKIPLENWERFTLKGGRGIFIVLIPETSAQKLVQLNGQEIAINIWDGNQIRETITIPVRTSAQLREHGAAPLGAVIPPEHTATQPTTTLPI